MTRLPISFSTTFKNHEKKDIVILSFYRDKHCLKV